VVPSCKPCNNAKKLLTPAELLLRGRQIAELEQAETDDESAGER
jgi:hypothetical protein